jgi:prolyl-tRNA synthetase
MAASVEQRHDEAGIIWPRSLAPYDAHVVALQGVEEQALEAAQELARGGAAVLLDDRELRPGEKFADADLLGIPTRVTVGKKTLEDGKVDLRHRAAGADTRVGVSELGKEVF